jgi:FKBP-type peptidyl-prolyl cis-trans isomerase FklB
MKLKNLILSGMVLCLSHNSYALDLTTQKQKYSYAVGIQIGQMLKTQDIDNIEVEAFAFAVGDYLENKQPQLSNEEMRAALEIHYEKVEAARAEVAKENLAKGTKYREEQAQRQGVTALESGLLYEELTPGQGESPKAEDRVEVHYKGTLIDGTLFDSSYERGQPAQFKLNGVVSGFREAITRMKPGAKWRVVMPPELAYGDKGAGKHIGPNETLVFEIEYLGLAAKPQAEAK